MALVVGTMASCSGDDRSVPSELVDGTPARPSPVPLEGVAGPTIVSRVRVLRRDALRQSGAIERCLGLPSGSEQVAVERVGVSGASVTVLGSRGRDLHGCDASVARATGVTRWCGHAFARLRAGRLRDPRLSLTCHDPDGDPLGFVWVQPSSEASYVAVARSGYHEVHPVVGGLPTRVTTDAVDPADASAMLDVSEHARDGRRLQSYELDARVSG